MRLVAVLYGVVAGMNMLTSIVAFVDGDTGRGALFLGLTVTWIGLALFYALALD